MWETLGETPRSIFSRLLLLLRDPMVLRVEAWIGPSLRPEREGQRRTCTDLAVKITNETVATAVSVKLSSFEVTLVDPE